MAATSASARALAPTIACALMSLPLYLVMLAMKVRLRGALHVARLWRHIQKGGRSRGLPPAKLWADLSLAQHTPGINAPAVVGLGQRG